MTGAHTQIGGFAQNKCAFDLAFSLDGTQLFGTRIDNDEPDTSPPST